MRDDHVTPIPKGEVGGARYCSKTGKPKMSCDCRSCVGRRSQRKGKDRQRAARKAIEASSGVLAARFAGKLSNEEAWSGLYVRVEAKSGAQCNPVATRFLLSEQQSEAARPIGDNRPFVATFAPDGWGGDQIICFRMSKLAQVIDGLAGVGG